MIYPPTVIDKKYVRLDAEKPLRVQHVHKTEPYAMHGHDFSEICIIWEGAGVHVSGKKREQLGPGSVLVLHPGSQHGYADVHDLKVTNIYYLDHWFIGSRIMQSEFRKVLWLFFQNSFRKNSPHGMHWKLDPQWLVSCRKEIEDLEDSRLPANMEGLWMRSSFMKLLCLLSSGFSQGQRQMFEQIPDGLWRMMEKVEFILEAGGSLTVDSFAKEEGFSSDYLSRLFKKNTGRGLSGFFQHRRVQHACRHLLLGENTITEVAHRLGFCDASHLGRVFKKEMEMTPFEYRKKYCS